MRFSAERAPLLSAIKAASSPISRCHVPVLECLHVIAKDNRVRLIGSNMDVEAQAICAAAVSEAGECNVSAEIFRAALERSSGTLCEVTLGDDLSVTCGPVSVDIPSITDEFPRLQKPDTGTEIDLGAEALAFCSPFCADAGYTSWAQGVHFGDGFATAYDSAAFAWHEAHGGAGQIIPRDSAPVARKFCDRLFLTDRAWRAESEGIHAAGKLLEGPYHSAWRQLIRPGDTVASFDADDAKGALSASLIGGARRVVLSLDGPNLTSSGDNGPTSKARKSEGSCACDADAPICVVLDAGRVDKILAALSGSTVNLSFTDVAAFFIPIGGKDRGIALGLMRDARNIIPGRAAAA